MKLNPDCIRDILFEVESSSTIDKPWIFDSENPSDRLSPYDKKEIAYHARYCMEAGLLKGFKVYGDCDTLTASDLSPEGHEFLSDIRHDTNWNKTKEIASKAGSFSLDILKNIAIGIATSYAQKQLNFL